MLMQSMLSIKKLKGLENLVSELRTDRRTRDEADAEVMEKIRDLFISYKAMLALFGATPYDLPHRLDLRSFVG